MFAKISRCFADTTKNFDQLVTRVTSQIALTKEIIAYIEEKQADTLVSESDDRLAEMRRDCSIYVSRLAKLKSDLSNLQAIFLNLKTHRKEMPHEDLTRAVDDLVKMYSEWYERYRDFKDALKSSKDKWYGFENEILATV